RAVNLRPSSFSATRRIRVMATADDKPSSSPTPPEQTVIQDGERSATAPPVAKSMGRQDYRESTPGPANPGRTAQWADRGTTPPDVLPNEPHRPVRFGEYEIMELIGQGAMGTVYKAQHHLLHVVDAVKFIRSGYAANTALRARFLNEMRTLVKLD